MKVVTFVWPPSILHIIIILVFFVRMISYFIILCDTPKHCFKGFLPYLVLSNVFVMLWFVFEDESRPELIVLVRQTSVVVVAGSTAELVCYVSGSQPQLVWSRAGGLPPGSTQRDGVLTIPNIQLSGAGQFVCTAIAPTGERGTVTTTVTVNPEAIGKCQQESLARLFKADSHTCHYNLISIKVRVIQIK